MSLSRGLVTIAVSLGLASSFGGTATGGPAQAVEEGTDDVLVEITDPPGDANGIPAAEGPDTRPASDDRADILRVWAETTFETVREVAEDGTILKVRHVPEGLRMSVRTTAPARPATGPTLRFGFPGSIGGCDLSFRFHVRGPLSRPDDPSEGAEFATTEDACPGGRQEYRAGFDLTFEGQVARALFPFGALQGTPAEVLVLPGREMASSGAAFSRVMGLSTGGLLLWGPVDMTVVPADRFVIGSDVPPDVDCRETPDHPECQP